MRHQEAVLEILKGRGYFNGVKVIHPLNGVAMLLKRRTSQITLADLTSLIDNQVREGKAIEYKEALPGGSDADRREFLADISSFANAAGGHIVYGCKERREDGKPTGIPEELVGLPGCNLDLETTRLSQMALAGIEPRIHGLDIGAVPNSQQVPILIVSIPKSLQTPHMVTFQNLSRFFARSNAGKFQLDVNDIRTAFLASHSLRQTVSNFSLERMARIRGGDTPIPMADGIQVVLHLLPLAAFEVDATVDLGSLKSDHNLRPLGCDGWGHRYNFDGLVINSTYSAKNPALSYVQLFRNGALEAMMCYEKDEAKMIPSLHLEEVVLDGVGRYANALNKVERSVPIIVRLSLLNTEGARLAVRRADYWPDREYLLKEQDLLLPEVYLEELGDAIPTHMRQAFDVLWQAAGHSGSINFDEDGKWAPKR